MTEYALPEYVAAEELREVRKKLKMTQKEFAELLGISRPTIERWERSDEKVAGPVVLLLNMISNNPEYINNLKVPKKTYPLRMWYMYNNKPCTLIDVDEINRKVEVKLYR